MLWFSFNKVVFKRIFVTTCKFICKHQPKTRWWLCRVIKKLMSKKLLKSIFSNEIMTDFAFLLASHTYGESLISNIISRLDQISIRPVILWPQWKCCTSPVLGCDLKFENHCDPNCASIFLMHVRVLVTGIVWFKSLGVLLDYLVRWADIICIVLSS